MSEDVATAAPVDVREPDAAPGASALQSYGRFYAPMALLSLASTCVPLFQATAEREEAGKNGDFMSMWETRASEGSVGILVCLVLSGLLVAATFSRSRGFGLPLAISLWTVLPLSMLLVKFGFRDPKPDLSAMGGLALGLMIGLLLIALAHTAHAILVRSGQVREPGRR